MGGWVRGADGKGFDYRERKGTGDRGRGTGKCGVRNSECGMAAGTVLRRRSKVEWIGDACILSHFLRRGFSGCFGDISLFVAEAYDLGTWPRSLCSLCILCSAL